MGATFINIPMVKADPYAVPYEDGFSTTFWSDFSIADAFGKEAVQDTFNRAFAEWKSDVRYLTDLVVVLNHKIFQHFNGDRELSKLYDSLWKIADSYAMENLSGKDFEYFFNVTD